MQHVVRNAIDGAAMHENYIAPLFSLPRKVPKTAWEGHIPFLFALFKNLRPANYVELGVHLGASFIAAATAAQMYGLESKLLGVDTWQGDDHAGTYEGDRIYSDLKAFMESNFANCFLLRSTFDEAVKEFRDRPIDLLHIDGLHTYEAVKHDYEAWLPVMSNRGVILFHDTIVRERDFGVWRLWEELIQGYPSLSFAHSHGLGVLFVGKDSLSDPYLRRLTEDASLFAAYRSAVEQIASLLPLRCAHQRLEADVASSISQSLAADVIVQNYKSQLETIQKPIRRLLRPKRKGLLAKLGLR